jgi:EAL domain-containing protein (putative c-di-GMP-specific phosphodiesterase class I)
MSESLESAEIVRSIVDLAKALNMETTCEGIETSHQLDQLRTFGSDRGQGFLFSRPMPAADLDRVLASATGVPFAA